MSPLKILLIVILIVVLLGVYPAYTYIGAPSLLGVVLIVVVIALLFGKL